MEEMERKLLRTIAQYMDEKEQALIRQALSTARLAHAGQKRKSGEPYLIHPIAVAQLVADMGMDSETVCAALLHDVVEDTSVSLDSIREDFGEEVAMLVDSVTKLDRLNFFSKSEAQVESMRKMLVAMAKDVRVILIKLCDRLHNMRTLQSLSSEAQIKNAQETIEIYAPIAARLGIFAIKSELETLSLKYLEPEQYQYILDEVEHLKEGKRGFLKRRIQEISDRLDEVQIHHEITGREKQPYSIYRKMQRQGRKPGEMYDIMALRILVDSVNDCYAALGIVHTMYKPIPGRFKDYIAVPKSNMYQSLHTSLISRDGGVFEVQIRTFEMHRTAEYGVAAHWKYKEGRKQDDDFDKKFSLIRELQELQADTVDPHEFLDTVRGDMFSDDVFVFTPKGEVITLVRGATPIDFAYRIHSKVGDSCVGCKANGRIVPLDYQLQTGDVVEILTSGSKGPSRDWLNVAKTSQAKSRIRQWFKRALREENIAKGRDMLEKAAKRLGYDFYTQLLKPEWLEKIYRKYTFGNEEDMYSAVGYGGVTTNQILARLIEEYKREHKEEIVHEPSSRPEEKKSQEKKSESGIVVKGYDDMLVRVAHCCNPVPGDDIIGFITRGRGVSVHRRDCLNILNLPELDRERLIDVDWAVAEKQGYSADIRIITVNKMGIFAELGVNAKTGKNDTFMIDFTVQIKDIGQLEEIIRVFRSMPDVVEVYRSTT